jgi:hypothetical protein
MDSYLPWQVTWILPGTAFYLGRHHIFLYRELMWLVYIDEVFLAKLLAVLCQDYRVAKASTVVTDMCHCYYWPLHLDFYELDQCKHSLMAHLHESIISHSTSVIKSFVLRSRLG